MGSMESFRKRLEVLEWQTEQWKHQTQALEAQTQVLKAHIHTVERRLRWWRGIACGVGLLALVSLPLQSGTAADTQPGAMVARMATLEEKLSTFAFDATTNEVVIAGANLRIVNGLGATATTNGLGNLIVGYNEPRGFEPDRRTGSHNVVVGREHNFSSFGGGVVGYRNEISGGWASVSGGTVNTASGAFASVSGGDGNQASGTGASVSGGGVNTASGLFASVSGGYGNTASGEVASSVSGGDGNQASGRGASVSGGASNRALGVDASVSGGSANTASGTGASVSGGEVNTASDFFASVSGGEVNTASGTGASVSGGRNRTAPAQDNWAAGALLQPN